MEKSKIIQNSIDVFKKLPSVGPKTAERFVYYLLKNPDILEKFIQSLSNLMHNVKRCRYCNDFSESDPCEICSNKKRNTKLLCVVEKHQDLYAIENTGYQGLYYILTEIVNPLEGQMIKKTDLEKLFERIQNVEESIKPQEVIIATGLTTEGELTASYILEFLKSKNINLKISRIAKGLPTGADIEYADSQTLSFALSNRTKIYEKSSS